jgi:hypothetical protein
MAYFPDMPDAIERAKSYVRQARKSDVGHLTIATDGSATLSWNDSKGCPVSVRGYRLKTMLEACVSAGVAVIDLRGYEGEHLLAHISDRPGLRYMMHWYSDRGAIVLHMPRAL